MVANFQGNVVVLDSGSRTPESDLSFHETKSEHPFRTCYTFTHQILAFPRNCRSPENCKIEFMIHKTNKKQKSDQLSRGDSDMLTQKDHIDPPSSSDSENFSAILT